MIQTIERLAIRNASPSFEPAVGPMPCLKKDIQKPLSFDIASAYPALASST
jgi:hypothetical protein